MKIFIENFRIEGVHGVTSKEKGARQPFQVDVCADLCQENIPRVDVVEATFDYRKMKKIVKQVVCTETYALLESVAARIANLILEEDDRITLVSVTIRKTAIWNSGTPGVTIRKSRS